MGTRYVSFGYEITDGKLAVIPQEERLVKSAFELYISGKSFKNIADRFTMTGIEYREGKPDWNKNMIKRMIENKRYCGKDDYPRIISDEVYKRANELKAKKQLDIDKLNERMRDALYKNSAGEITTDELDEICAEIMQESKKLREENKKHTMEIQMKGAEQARLKQIFEAIDHMSEQMTEFDDETVRTVVERIDVISQDKIIIWLIGGISYEKELTKAA